MIRPSVRSGARAFTLVEVLLTFAIIGVLAALVIPATSHMTAYASRVKSVSNLRQIGVAARLYANDHNQQLPGHPAPQDLGSPAPDQWPTLLCYYLSPSDPRVFLDSSDSTTNTLPLSQVVSNLANNTAFVYNGFDDLGSDNQPPPAISLNLLGNPAQVALLGLKTPGASSFFVDLLFQPLSFLSNLLNTAAFDGGAVYLFADGSVRFLPQGDYTNSIWLVNKTFALPSLHLPLPTPLPGGFRYGSDAGSTDSTK
jgi:prepilin-type N-terminal cleavage/methylation domain-containing protein/prepilin-type processing-associated H-X9-DG protein